jgi:hypothetical protein
MFGKPSVLTNGMHKERFDRPNWPYLEHSRLKYQIRFEKVRHGYLKKKLALPTNKATTLLYPEVMPSSACKDYEQKNDCMLSIRDVESDSGVVSELRYVKEKTTRVVTPAKLPGSLPDACQWRMHRKQLLLLPCRL